MKERSEYVRMEEEWEAWIWDGEMRGKERMKRRGLDERGRKKE